MKPVKKFFVYKCKLSLSLALLYLVDLVINKLKAKYNDLFYRMILNTKRIVNSFWRNFPVRAKQMPSKILFVSKKHWPKLCTKIVIVGNSKWVKNHPSNIVFNYLTVLVHTKTIIHLSVGG